MPSPVTACRSALALTAGILLLVVVSVTAGQQGNPASWLDLPLANWNAAGQAVPAAPAADEPTGSVISRCKLTPPRSTPAERAIDPPGGFRSGTSTCSSFGRTSRSSAECEGQTACAGPWRTTCSSSCGGQFAGILVPDADDVAARQFVRRRADGAAGRHRGVRALPQHRSPLLPVFQGDRPLRIDRTASGTGHRARRHQSRAPVARVRNSYPISGQTCYSQPQNPSLNLRFKRAVNVKN